MRFRFSVETEQIWNNEILPEAAEFIDTVFDDVRDTDRNAIYSVKW